MPGPIIVECIFRREKSHLKLARTREHTLRTVVKRHINKTRWWFFTTPSEKYATVKLDHFPKEKGVKIKYTWVTTHINQMFFAAEFWWNHPPQKHRPRCHRRCGRVAQYISEIASCHFCGENPFFFQTHSSQRFREWFLMMAQIWDSPNHPKSKYGSNCKHQKDFNKTITRLKQGAYCWKTSRTFFFRTWWVSSTTTY